jgi:hypothetical protein
LTSCLKAIWAVARLAEKDSSYPQQFHSIEESYLHSDFIRKNQSLAHYSTSAFALLRWSRLCSRTGWINEGLKMLAECEECLVSSSRSNIAPTIEHLKVLLPNWPSPQNIGTTAAWIKKTSEQLQLMKQSLRNKPFNLCLRFLTDCSLLDSLPYQFDLTWDRFRREISTPPEYGLLMVQQMYERFAFSHSAKFGDPSVQDFDKFVGVLFPLWQRFVSGNSKFLPQVVSYINTRTCDDAVYHALRSCDKSLSSRLLNGHPDIPEMDMLTAAYRLLRFPRALEMTRGHMDESALDALRRAAPSAIALSVTALVHHQNIIHSIGEPIYETPDLRRDKTADYPLDIHP